MKMVVHGCYCSKLSSTEFVGVALTTNASTNMSFKFNFPLGSCPSHLVIPNCLKAGQICSELPEDGRLLAMASGRFGNLCSTGENLKEGPVILLNKKPERKFVAEHELGNSMGLHSMDRPSIVEVEPDHRNGYTKRNFLLDIQLANSTIAKLQSEKYGQRYLLGGNCRMQLDIERRMPLTAIKVLHTQFVLGMHRRKLQAIAKMLVILSGVQTLQGSAEALASTITTQGVNDILGGDFKSGFASALLLIFFSELGDKTFFIAALLATRKSNVAVFTGTFGALVAMTFISVVLGRTFHYIDGVLPFSLGDSELPLDDLAAVGLLIYFGISSLVEAGSTKGSKVKEEQQEAELAITGVDGEGIGMQADTKTVIATFALVFAAEWGDKSFFSTIALAAASSPLGVVTGAIAGHGAATVLAVLGGSVLGTFVSEKIIAYTGGILFLIFAGITLVEVISGSK
ncbi:hypothetical protein O6H91_21G007400 [Diphasiastrum complanatum]|uniref:Uncharacterized protein n=8 Tax=Diphasiastrum complanatum TaxID=34168 RepID=A0ACC2AHG9_DIPCM|nr:hypothetical protein O6H91_21G007400 [Diphasiastrum complanatum]KAJ7516982.1 hypothetical protein O6H91_21G007400 [Diphasiastrum complanatum]KAJ7516983.1 hypothetical protein O6H91_21G007400 [Diphasiastrum complanatum]KAJ7516984.1 hypothetical protein O6H91_21G007400 [Diphasiastrum complanatum]KAJ7516986.1 hypothetical protein O6H91_21G007400 [Diphasiastrum complanatum]